MKGARLPYGRAQQIVVLGKPIRDYVDTLVHASARADALTASRHRTFIAARLSCSLIALAMFPVQVAYFGVPSAYDVIVLSWLVVPMVVAAYLSRTGDYERAQLVSAITMSGLAATIAVASGGLGALSGAWFAIIVLEAALSASNRVVAFAAILTFGVTALLAFLQVQVLIPDAQPYEQGFEVLCAGAAVLYGACLVLSSRALLHTSIDQLRTREDRYHLLAANMRDAVLRHDRNGAVTFASPAAGPLLELPPEQLLGDGLLDRVHLADRRAYVTTLADVSEFGHARSVEIRIAREPEKSALRVPYVWVELRCEPLVSVNTAPNRRDVIAVMRDITIRKEQETVIETLRSEIEQAAVASSAFLAIVGREQARKAPQQIETSDDRAKSSA